MKVARYFLTIFFQSGILALVAGQEAVKVWEAPLTLPTYVVEAADKNPMFFRNQSYQGASRYIYPYALEDNITDRKIEKTYKALYLENEYIKLCVLPEIGGRLFYATDKTNGYEIFYRQHVVKPANIGMLGAWISGGIEFCVFHHHRASTNQPVDYTLKQNDDGSATIWIGETEPRHRMKWSLGISLFPGKSYIEVDGRLINPTDQVNSILYWANVATHVNEDYQVIFPPSADFAVYHAKNSFAHWPVTTEVYNGHEYYRDSIDASWWKNHPNPISLFAHDLKDGFLAGYDHGRKAGTMHVANRHIVKGAKLWEWGPGSYGSMWDSQVLTDNDGPYAELMTGAYSDNQPDYSWLKPYELKTFKQFWYPLRETEGAVAANLDAAVNLKKVSKNELVIAANSTQKLENAVIRLLKGEETVFEATIDISPAAPFHQKLVFLNANEEDFKVILKDKSGRELIVYQPEKKADHLPLPEPVEPPKNPKEITSLEELYLTGLRIKQFHNARLSPEDYFGEALKRDPLDIRSNTMTGVIRKGEGRWEEAANHFRSALKRLTANYTRPRNCEPFFHLGVILQQQGKYEAAYDTLYRAAWDQAFASAAYYHLAQISVGRADWHRALDEIDRSLAYNSSNLNALNLKTAILRKEGSGEKARLLTEKVLQKDPLNFWAQHELSLISGDQKVGEKLKKIMRDNPESYLELAAAYLNSGLSGEAKNILLEAAGSENTRLNSYPTLHYYLGYIFLREKDPARAKQHFEKAGNGSTDYCFPYRLESVAVFQAALEKDPSDARACYYLGNVLYDKQPEKAIDYWQKAVELEPALAIAHRNLGWGYNQTLGDLEQAIAAYENAIMADKTQARYYYELDKLYERAGADIKKRHQLLTRNHQYVAQRPDALLQEVQVLSLAGDHKKAIDLLEGHFFPRQEGIDNLHDIYVDACLGQGLTALNSGKHQTALDYFQQADEYPENHQIGRNDRYQKNAQIYYYQALALEKLGMKKEAEELYKKVAGLKIRDPEFLYYKALALQYLEEDGAADALAEEIGKAGEEKISRSGGVDFFSKFGEGQSGKARESGGHYLLGLAELLRGEQARAKDEFKTSLQLDPSQLWASIYLDR